MSAGKLRCVGSSLFLKDKFGVGYTLSIGKEPQFDISKVTELILSYVPNGKEVRNVGKECIWQLPLNASENFQPLFAKFDEEHTSLEMCNHGT